MEPITMRHLDFVVAAINEAQGTPSGAYSPRDIDGKIVGNIGNYHLGSAYGGWSLEQMMNEQGGVRDVFHVGHVPKRHLHGLLQAYRAGLTEARRARSWKASGRNMSRRWGPRNNHRYVDTDKKNLMNRYKRKLRKIWRLIYHPVLESKKIAAWQKGKAHVDHILAVIAIFFRGRVLGPLPQDPRPLWEEYRKASSATDDAYVASVEAEETGASEWKRQDLWDAYQNRGTEMWDALDTYHRAMDGHPPEK